MARDWRRLFTEIGGGFGDIGLLAPLAVALITLNHLNATAVLVGAGVFYIVTALVYRLPVPVQPLKAVSAIAIAGGLGPPGIAAAGLMMGVIFVALSLTGAADLLSRIFAKPVVRGIQLGIGLLLAKASIDLMLRPHQLTFGAGALEQVGLTAPILVGMLILVLLLVANRRALPGAALVLLGLGTLVGVLLGVHAALQLHFGPQPLVARFPSRNDFGSAFWVLVVPQVGLSIGNSVIATASAAKRYFGEPAAKRVTPRRLALSMGLANLVVSPLGGMPMCHGAGGMTAHVRTGARTGVAIAVYGSVLALLGLALGGSAPSVLSLIPPAVLAGFLLYVAIEHASLVSDLRGREEFLVAGAIGCISIATGNISAGVIVGLGLHYLLRWTGGERSQRPFASAPSDLS